MFLTFPEHKIKYLCTAKMVFLEDYAACGLERKQRKGLNRKKHCSNRPINTGGLVA